MTYASKLLEEQRQSEEGNFPGRRKLPEWLIVKLYNEKLYGGYSKKRNKLCPVCRVLKSNNGACNCTE